MWSGNHSQNTKLVSLISISKSDQLNFAWWIIVCISKSFNFSYMSPSYGSQEKRLIHFSNRIFMSLWSDGHMRTDVSYLARTCEDAVWISKPWRRHGYSSVSLAKSGYNGVHFNSLRPDPNGRHLLMTFSNATLQWERLNFDWNFTEIFFKCSKMCRRLVWLVQCYAPAFTTHQGRLIKLPVMEKMMSFP